MQETWVQSLLREDSTRWVTTKPVHRNQRACPLEPALHVREATATRGAPCVLQLEKVRVQCQRSSTNKWVGSQFTRNIYIQNSKELTISIYTHYVHIYKYSVRLEGGFWISPQVLREKLLAS